MGISGSIFTKYEGKLQVEFQEKIMKDMQILIDRT